MKRLLCALSFALCVCGASAVYAADITASEIGMVDFAKTFDTSGFETEYDNYFSYRVTDAKDNIYAYGQTTQSGGDVSFSFRIKGESGTYTLTLSNRKLGKKTYTIEYVNNLYVDFNDTKALASADEMNAFLLDSGNYCGLDIAAYKRLGQSEKNNVINYFNSASDASTMAQLTAIFDGANVTNRFFTTTSDASLIKSYIEESCTNENSPFSTPEARVFANDLTEEKKLTVAKTLSGKTVTESLLAAFKLEVLKARVSQITYYADMEEVIYSDGNIWGFRDTDLNGLYSADTAAVYKGMISGIGTISSLSEYSALLTKLISENPASSSSFPDKNGNSFGSSVVGSGDIIMGWQTGGYKPVPDQIENEMSSAYQSAQNIKFKDLAGYEWAQTAINKLVENYVVSGMTNTEFEPGRTIKREEFVKMITAGLRLTGAEAVSTFGDVKDSDWFYPYVAAAQRANIVSGDTENNFGAGADITRQDAAVMVSRALTASGTELEMGEGVTFTDEERISGYAKSAVSNLAKAGIINGMDDGSFAPQNSITRAEAAQMLYGFLSKAGLLKW